MAKLWLNLFDRPYGGSLDPKSSPGSHLITTGVYPGTALFATKEMANAVQLVPEVIHHNAQYGVRRIGCIEIDVPDDLVS